MIALCLTLWGTDELFSLAAAQQYLRATFFPYSSQYLLLSHFFHYSHRVACYMIWYSHCAFSSSCFSAKIIKVVLYLQDEFRLYGFRFLCKNASKIAIY